MLVNPKTNDDSYAKQLVQMFGDYMQNPEPGILIVPLNYNHCLIGVKEKYPKFNDRDLGPYGVCDSVENFKEVYASLLTDPRSFCVLFTPMRRSEQSPDGGWRWHKWGSYIGKMDPQCEYLYNEPLIEEVFVFSILELEPS